MFIVMTGVIAGFISGLGMGGGTILILFLSFLGIEQHIAQASNLIFFIPTSIIAIYINMKNKNIDIKLAVIIIICGIIGAITGASIAVKIDVNLLRKCFGIFLAIIAIHEIYTIIKEYIKNKNTHNI